MIIVHVLAALKKVLFNMFGAIEDARQLRRTMSQQYATME